MQDLKTSVLLLLQAGPAVHPVVMHQDILEPLHQNVEHLLSRLHVLTVEQRVICEVDA